LNRADKKEDLDVEEEEENEEDTEEPTTTEVARRQSVKKGGKPGQRVTVVLGVNFKGSEEPSSQPGRASSKGLASGKVHKKKTILKDKH